VTDQLIGFVDPKWWQIDDLNTPGDDKSPGHATSIQ
jgi:hypothetical protein